MFTRCLKSSFLLFGIFLFPLPCAAEKTVTVVEPSLIIQPQETKSVTIQAEPLGISEIFWQTLEGTINGTDCQNTACIRIYDKNLDYTTETFNYGRQFEPGENPLILELTNIADTPVKLEIRRSANICSAESCAFFTTPVSDERKIIRIKHISSFIISTDGSYSKIAGTTVQNNPFNEIFIWRSYDNETTSECPDRIKTWLNDPQSYPPPYILGGAVYPPSEKNQSRLSINIDTCIPGGDDFNADQHEDFDYNIR